MRVRNKVRAARRAKLRTALFLVLGDRCKLCGTKEQLEVHHVDGCTWNQRTHNAEHRLYRYLRELREGVRLDVLCRSCNARVGRPVSDTDETLAVYDSVSQQVEGAPF